MQKIELVRSNRRSIAIEVTSDLRVIVRAPRRLSEREINRFVGEKADWIDIHLRKMKERQELHSEGQNKALTEQEIRLLTTRAKRVFPPKVKKYAEIIGVTYGNITIRMQKSRWGSCSGKGNQPAEGRTPEPREPAFRMPFPHEVPLCDGTMCRGGTGAAGINGNPRG